MSTLTLDAEALYRELLRGVRQLCAAQTRLVGITSGGAWLAQRLHADMQLDAAPGVISSAQSMPSSAVPRLRIGTVPDTSS